MNKFVFEFGNWKFKFQGKDYKDAVRKNKTRIQKKFKITPKHLPMLVKIKHNHQDSWWDIREFFKEAGIKIEVG